MLTEEHLTQLAAAMIMHDVLKKNKAEGHETDELRGYRDEVSAWIDGIMKTLNEEEQNQAMDRYLQERNSGEYKTLPKL